MKKHLILILVLFALAIQSQAQIGYGTNNPDPRAVIELSSTDKAFYLPRLTTVQLNAQTGWKEGMMIYNTDSNCVYFRGAADWKCVGIDADGDAWGVDGENQDSTIGRLGSVGIGTTSPTERLDVNGKLRVRDLSDKTGADTSVTILVSDENGVIDEIERYWLAGGDSSRSTSTTNIFTSSMTATQPTTYQSFTANRAINGNTSSSDRSLTGQQVFPWWRLDMGSNKELNRLRFFQFLSSGFRLSNFYVILSENAISLPATPTQTDVDTLVNDTVNNTVIHYTGQIPNWSGDITFDNTTARYMIVVRNISTVDYLQISEVQAFNDIYVYENIGTVKNNVGIGTTSPSQKLHVAGGVRITTMTDLSSIGSDKVVTVDGSGNLRKISADVLGSDDQKIDTLALQGDTLLQISLEGDGESAQALDLRGLVKEPWFGDDDDAAATTNTENIYHMGKVGIGTTSPIDKLHIKQNWFDNNANDWGGGVQLEGDGPSLSFWETNDGSNRKMLHYQGGKLQFYRRASTPSTAPFEHEMTLDNSGNLGIGTASPSTKLHVVGGARITSMPTGSSSDQVVVVASDGVLKKVSQGTAEPFKVRKNGSVWNFTDILNVASVNGFELTCYGTHTNNTKVFFKFRYLKHVPAADAYNMLWSDAEHSNAVTTLLSSGEFHVRHNNDGDPENEFAVIFRISSDVLQYKTGNSNSIPDLRIRIDTF